MENGGVIITDFVNLKKGKIDKNWKGLYPGLRGEWIKLEPKVVKKLSHF